MEPKSSDMHASGSVKSAARAFAIMECFERRRCPLSLSEITSALALPTSSAAALLKTLVEQGYLEYDRSRRLYSPTMRIVELGRWVENVIFGDGAILAAARELHEATGLTALIAIRSDLHAQYLQLVHRGDVFGAAATPGVRRPLASSAMGLALLSGLDHRMIPKLVRRINYGKSATEQVDMPTLRVQLHEVRATGHAFSKDRIQQGIAAVAVLIPETPGGRAIALGLGGPSDVITQQRVGLAARLAASRDALIARVEVAVNWA